MINIPPPGAACRGWARATYDPSVSQSVFTITKKAPTKGVLLVERHYAKRALTPTVSRHEIGSATLS